MSDQALNIIGPVGVRRFVLANVCDTHVGHEHNYDHGTVVISGRIRVLYSYPQDGQVITGESRDYGQGEWVTIRAHVRHTIKALDPNTQYQCVFSHRDMGGLVSQRYTGNQAAYD